MTTLVSEIRARIAANIETAIPEGVQVSPYALAQPTPPAIHVLPAELEYDLAMGRGLDRWTFTVQAFVAFNTDIAPQQLIDEFMSDGDRSLKAAIESDRQLAGAVDDLRVTRIGGYRLQDRGDGTQLIVVDFNVDVLASNEP